MKRLLFLLTLVFSLGFSAKAQDSTSANPLATRIALPNPTKDTLYVVKPMYGMVVSMWNDPQYEAEKPVFIPVNSLEGYIRRYNY